MRSPKTAVNRQALATQALQAAVAMRAKAKLDQHSPICVYGLCDALGIRVRFNNINMEGMYQRGVPPRIHLSARRPLPRRTYNCAHELGHHALGHGSSIDELREDSKKHSWEEPKEFLADAFAGFLLMPVVGLRGAFTSRGWNADTASSAQMFTIACHFGVGYNTMLTHLSLGVRMLPWARVAALQRTEPKAIRAELIGAITPHPLLVADRHSIGGTLDAEVKMLLLLPARAEVAGNALMFERDTPNGRLFRATRPGIVQAIADGGSWSKFVRIAPEGYVGLANYRHLEPEDDGDE